MVKHKPGNRGSRNPKRYLDIVTAFDIETSNLPDSDTAIMYVWQWQFADWCTVMGRTWTELRQFIGRLTNSIPYDATIVVLVHNLSFEFQFLRTIYNFSTDEVFALDRRKVAKCTMNDKALEFRCTYIHSNMSLSAYCKKMNVEHGKLSGDEFDYREIRYPWTVLTAKQIAYCQNDVLGLVEAYTKEMEMDDDNLETIPLTSTGYVRRDVKRAMRICGTKHVKEAQPNVAVYQLLKEAFRGGDTHANRYYTNRIISDVKSADRSSSYPDVLVNCKFPLSEFQPASSNQMSKLLKAKRALLFRVSFKNIQLSDIYWGFPYISRSKCLKLEKPCCDNGRVMSAEYLQTTVTDVDWLIIKEQYKWDEMQVTDLHYARYGFLPNPLVLTCIEYYRDKTTLKGSPEGSYEEMLYGKKKALLNSIYGCMAQDQCKQSIIFNGDNFEIDDKPLQQLLDKAAKNAYLCYAWGVWITAWARLRLQEGLRLAGDNAVYCDTDSVKYVGDVDWAGYNEKRIKSSIRNSAYADDKDGNRHYMGVFERDGEYDKFITLGAKKYAYEQGNDLHLTVSGVNKQKGAEELKAAGGLEAFREGMVFSAAGGTESVYNDDVLFHVKQVDGHDLEIGPNICIKDSTYTLGLTAEYARLLETPDRINIDYE